MIYHSMADLLKDNRAWVAYQNKVEPDYFEKLSQGQSPPYLYIGCSDSRMPLTKFTQTEPGEMFVHRNIANQVCLTDINFLSVLEYAIGHLHVQHIIVCGHYCCGGIQAALEGTATGLVDSWVNPVRQLYLEHQAEIDRLTNRNAKLNYLAELNVETQVKNLYQTSIMRKALREGSAPEVHGWVLDLHSGLIKDLNIATDEWLLPPSCQMKHDLELSLVNQ